MTSPPLLNADALARRLGVSRDWAYRLMERGDIAVTRLGRNVRVSEDALAAYIASRTATPRRSRKGAAA